MKSKMTMLISIYEIIIGVVGVCVSIFFIVAIGMSENVQLRTLLIFIFMLIFYSLSCIGSFLLWNENEKGIVISIISQMLQIPYIITSGCIYYIVSGLQLGINIVVISSETFKIAFMYNYGYIFEVASNSDVKNIIIGINLITIAVILCLRRIQKVEKSNQLEEKNEAPNVTSN